MLATQNTGQGDVMSAWVDVKPVAVSALGTALRPEVSEVFMFYMMNVIFVDEQKFDGYMG